MKLDSGQLRALASIIHHGSFERAARALHITPSAVSQRIRAMEEQLGVIVIQRGHPCRATPAGERLCRHAEAVGLLEHEALDALGLTADDSARPPLRIAVNADSLATWFVDVLARIDDVTLDLVIDNEEHSAEWLRRGQVSAVVSTAGTSVAGCDHAAIGSLRYRATASPAFHARWFAAGVSAETLSRAPSLQFNSLDHLQRRWVEQRFGDFDLSVAHRLPSTQAFVDAALRGVGWGMNPASLIAEHLRDNRLVTLCADADLDVPLSWQWSRAFEPALRSITEVVVETAAEHLVDSPRHSLR